jgi:kynureninase
VSALADRLAPHYVRFGVSERLLLTGHSHQAWPDAALDGVLEAFDDAAELVDEKWARAFAAADAVRAGFRMWLDDEDDAALALGSSTHELVVRMLSSLDLRARPRIVTTGGEFHTLRRQLARLGEVPGVEVLVVDPEPADTLAARLADAADEGTAAVFVSAVMFGTGAVVTDLGSLARACTRVGSELVVDAYHALGPTRFSVRDDGLQEAWVVGGGYKYLQLGEGCCFLRIPPHAAAYRPVITGWYAEFGDLAAERPNHVAYARNDPAARFAGSTYDPTSHYRAVRVLELFHQQGLDRDTLPPEYARQVHHLASGVEALGLDDVRREASQGGFLALRTPHAAAYQQALLRDHGVLTDCRGDVLRLGPAPYLTDAQLDAAVAALGAVARDR